VAEAGPPLSLTRLEQAIAEEKLEAQKELVLLYPDRNGKPSNTAGWLAPRGLDAHHHLRLGHDPDCQRLARRLTDRAVGLVLSGGGARGAVHGGVYKAMKELGIDGDIIGGVSMGALLGAMFAMEYDLDTMLELGRQHLTTKALMDYTFPAVALCKTKKVSQLMHKLFGEVAIEDLFIPYFCVSANLSKSQPVIHKTGPLSLALRASMAFPGIFAPVSYDGDILVDGAVMNNLPIDVMREQRGVGPIIAVTASPKDEKDHKWDLPLSISGWGVLRRRINPFAKPVSVPSIAATIMRTLDVNSTYLLQQTRGLADVIISPDTREYHNLDWAAYPHLVELGYQAAKKELAEWKRGSSGV
jgi:NTE family protein/lysophospholipid hydrolase